MKRLTFEELQELDENDLHSLHEKALKEKEEVDQFITDLDYLILN